MTKTCPTCGQTIPPELPLFGLRLHPIEDRIVRRVWRAGRYGISTPALFQHIYGHDPEGGPLTGMKTLHVHVWAANQKLKSIGKRMEGMKAGRNAPGTYRMIDL